ncbi:hypothetical protein TPHA_0E03840 [Tetrapisispora phaffii CBS 4417]|uniref:Receptor L-domain domain-containing protein n=1 Tax=Tetrapisispora phaffii (strain ATCC 24235 / CBS 4417 / NBRC 1672 / NRRL Y-8282 / UCD 70-5) TaxID=1071381 RepID=G8BU95_TETPH|nr:hypothetical protein TPHA_0E03840 [Tetrapisispora phaffii CBS 4417]CCE63473.1 hypothetical protein TPHA_0E03840 [Tetrapisispora phaffii CBS 4417]
MNLLILLLISFATASYIHHPDRYNMVQQGSFKSHNVKPGSIIWIQKRDLLSLGDQKFQLLNNELLMQKQDPFEKVSYEKSTPVLEQCRKDSYVIESKQELYALQNACQKLMGSIHISNYDSSDVDFGNIEEIEGSIQIEENSNIVNINAPHLKKIKDTFVLQSLTSLVSLNIPELVSVKVIDWKVVPILNYVQLNKEITEIESITISDTSLSYIDGFDNIEKISTFNINNNRFLETIKTNLKEVTEQFTIHANSRELELEMPELQYAKNITVRDTSKVSFPKLEKVTSSMEFIENIFTDLEIPTLTSVGGTVGIIDNPNLSNVDLSGITFINGGLMVTKNDKLTNLSFLPKLKQIGGAIHFEGKFQETDFPDLKLVKGSAYINSNSDQLDCDTWTTPVSGRSIIRGGKIECISGKKQKSLSVNEDGEVIKGSEKSTNNDEKDKSKDSGESSGKKPGYFSRIKNDSTSYSNQFSYFHLAVSVIFCSSMLLHI